MQRDIVKKDNRLIKIGCQKCSHNPKKGRKGKNRGLKNSGNKQKTNNKMVHLNPNLSMTTLNVNGLNTPIKRKILSEWIKKTNQPTNKN